MNDVARAAPFEPFTTQAQTAAAEATPISERIAAPTTVAALKAQAARRPEDVAVSFLMSSDPAAAPAAEISFRQLVEESVRLANALHAAGVAPGDRIALLAPNLPEGVFTMLAAHMLGVFAPINPMLEPEIIAAILREMDAAAVVTLAPTPGLDIAEKVAAAVADAPTVKIVVEASLSPYLGAPAPERAEDARIANARLVAYRAFVAGARADGLDFEREIQGDTIAALFHTGGTTGAPKLAPHRHAGIMAHTTIACLAFGQRELASPDRQAWLNALPLFHIFGTYGMLFGPLSVGAQVVLATPGGFRTPGLVENFWKLVERYRVTAAGAVPTALAVLAEAPVDADISSFEGMIVGGSLLPGPLGRAFAERTGVRLFDVYGMTEVNGIVATNPEAGVRRIGSVGVAAPYVRVRIAQFDSEGAHLRDCGTDEIGEICVDSPAKFSGYLDESRNGGVFHEGFYRTGDLGRLDAEGALYVTGRAKDIIIRGGHNIDASVIEDALIAHPDVAFVGAVGQPDAYAGEMPCAYVELVPGASADPSALQAFAAERVTERAARPAAVVVLDALPKTAVGKVFKPALRKAATQRVCEAALAAAGLAAATVTIEEDPKEGHVVVVSGVDAAAEAEIGATLNGLARSWRFA